VNALSVLTSPLFFAHRARIAELALKQRLPSISIFSVYPEAGGLMAYGPNFPAMYRGVTPYIDRIFKGANPGELPVERPTKFELVINVKTAKALGLTMPQALLARADRVIQ
jgi:putative ABC transport system substrate-binding protein